MSLPHREDRETARIRAEFVRRDSTLPNDFYALSSPTNLFLRHGIELELLSMLRKTDLFPLKNSRVLDLGCGDGTWLSALSSFGARLENLAGIDLDAARIERARAAHPAADLRVGRADALPWPDASFDLAMQFSMFTSILDEQLRHDVAREMVRVIRPGGGIIWVDFMYDNPFNASVKGISVAALRRLFPRAAISWHRVLLAPPLARRLVPLSTTAAFVLQRLKLFNTHALALIRP